MQINPDFVTGRGKFPGFMPVRLATGREGQKPGAPPGMDDRCRTNFAAVTP